MSVFLACVAIVERLLGWLPVVGWALRWMLERDLEVRISNIDQLLSDQSGYRYIGPARMWITNHSHDLAYKFCFQDGGLVIKRPVLPFLGLWRQEYTGCSAQVLGGQPRAYLSEFSLAPQTAEEFLIEFDLRFPNTGVTPPRQAQAVFRVPMIGRIRKLERVLANLRFAN
jgi:hypothetical protein